MQAPLADLANDMTLWFTTSEVQNLGMMKRGSYRVERMAQKPDHYEEGACGPWKRAIMECKARLGIPRT